jgi:hypothetical protein
LLIPKTGCIFYCAAKTAGSLVFIQEEHMLYKKFISVVILSTYLTALSPYAFGSIMNKIKNYNNAVQNLYGKALWFSSDNKNISDYAIKVADSPIAQSTYGDYAITTFGSIGAADLNHPLMLLSPVSPFFE